jgi:hypothetical protein
MIQQAPGVIFEAMSMLGYDPEDASHVAQFGVFLEAMNKYVERNAEYKDNWRSMGWRGQLIRVRERAERLWDSLWDAEAPRTDFTPWAVKKLDDALDGINFLGFLVRAVRENNRGGSWWK